MYRSLCNISDISVQVCVIGYVELWLYLHPPLVAGSLASVCTLEDVPLLEFVYFVITHMPGESYRRQLRSLLCLCDVF